MFHLHGHELAVRLLEKAFHRGRLHHAHLFVGPAHVGKTTLATQLAQAVNCEDDAPPCGACNSCRRIVEGQHADVRFIGLEPEEDDEARTMIGINEVRALQDMAYLRPYEGKCHVFIIQDADRMSAEAANALLKVLEEPPPDALLVLLTSNPDAVLPTVASRCQVLELRPLPVKRVAAVLRDGYSVAAEQAETFARLSRGCVGWAIQAVEEQALMAGLHQRLERIADVCNAGLAGRFAYADELARRFQRDRATGREELYLWLRWWRDVLLVQLGRGDEVVHRSWQDTVEGQAGSVSQAQTVAWIGRLYGTLDALDRNANPRLSLEAMLLDLPLRPQAVPQGQ